MGLNKPWFLGQAASSPGNIRARTWLILGAVGLVIIGLIVWAGLALLSWLWAQAPAVTEAGKRLAGAGHDSGRTGAAGPERAGAAVSDWGEGAGRQVVAGAWYGSARERRQRHRHRSGAIVPACRQEPDVEFKFSPASTGRNGPSLWKMS